MGMGEANSRNAGHQRAPIPGSRNGIAVARRGSRHADAGQLREKAMRATAAIEAS